MVPIRVNEAIANIYNMLEAVREAVADRSEEVKAVEESIEELNRLVLKDANLPPTHYRLTTEKPIRLVDPGRAFQVYQP